MSKWTLEMVRVDRCMTDLSDRDGSVRRRIYYEMWWQGGYIGEADTFEEAWQAIRDAFESTE